MGKIFTKDFGVGKCALIHNHFFKCAGSTVTNILKPHFPANIMIKDAWAYEDVARQAHELFEKHDTVFLHGHSAWGIHEYLPDEIRCYYFTWIREPFKRAVSNVNYDIASYYLTEDQFEFGLAQRVNSMVDFLAECDLELAKHRLAEQYMMCGFVERFDESVRYLCELLGIDTIHMNSVNVGSWKSNRQWTPSAAFKKNNILDYELYQWAWDYYAERLSRPSKVTIVPGKRIFHEKSDTVIKSIENREYEDVVRKLQEQLPSSSDSFQEPALQYIYANYTGKLDRHLGLKMYQDLCEQVPAQVLRGPMFDVTPNEHIQLILPALKKLPPADTEESDSIPRRMRQRLYRKVARCHVEAGDKEQAETNFIKALDANPSNWDTVKELVVFLRINDRAEDALKILLDQPAHICQREPWCIETLTTLHLVDGIEAARRFACENVVMISKSPKPSEAIPLSDLCEHEKLLLVRSAPELVCDDAVSAIAEFCPDTDIDAILQEGSFENNRDRLARVVHIKPGPFNPAEVMGAIGGALHGRGHTVVLVPVNGQSPLSDYSNFLEFANLLGCSDVYAYPLGNILLEDVDKFVVPLDPELEI